MLHLCHTHTGSGTLGNGAGESSSLSATATGSGMKLSSSLITAFRLGAFFFSTKFNSSSLSDMLYLTASTGQNEHCFPSRAAFTHVEEAMIGPGFQAASPFALRPTRSLGAITSSSSSSLPDRSVSSSEHGLFLGFVATGLN